VGARRSDPADYSGRVKPGYAFLVVSAGLLVGSFCDAPRVQARLGARLETVQPGGWPADGVARLVAAAFEQTRQATRYDGAYRRIPYPMGDVPADVGVCTDVVIRAYRAVGVDLQQRVHEDMRAAFSAYPKAWGLSRPDPNIDHRRVPNLQRYFIRRGTARPRSPNPADYQPGDLVTWMLPGNLPHIGVVSDRRSPDGRRPLIVHNIGRGPQVEDMLFAYPITGHYRYRGE
jgi:uncharacterized protein YijF (DUF1287 family)